MRSILRLFNILYLFWGFFSFFFWMILMMPFILLSYALFKGEKATDSSFIFLNIWVAGFNFFMAYRYQIINKEAVKKDKAYIFVVNHSSYLDSIAIVKVIPQSFKPLGKMEMIKVPIFGIIYKRVVILIDRSSRESRDLSIQHLKEQLANGQSILLFPEGTINKSEDLLGNFYDGAFKIAIETKVPILPLTLVNTKEMMPWANAFAIKPGKIIGVFSEEIAVNELSLADLPLLKQKVIDEMKSTLLKYKPS